MKPHITFITVGVDDLQRAVRFYRDGLGLPTAGVIGEEFGEHGQTCFFDMQPGLKLALFPRTSLAHDAGIPVERSSRTEFALAHNVRTPAEVDALLQQAANAGGTIVKPGQKTFWGGYAGYFQDLDGHLWEIAWNPQMLPEE